MKARCSSQSRAKRGLPRAGYGAWAIGLSLLVQNACISRHDFQQGSPATNSCTPGQIQCICDRDELCEGLLVCLANRCVARSQLPEPAGTGSSETEPSTRSTSTGANTQAPKGNTSASPTGSEQQEKGSSATSLDPADSSGTQAPGKQGGSTPTDNPQDPWPKSCEDGILNHSESDIDCGGPQCPPCALQARCHQGTDCASTICEEGRCVECNQDSHCDRALECVVDSCQENRCIARPRREGSACNDQDPCTAKDQCDSNGRCTGKSTLLLEESFDSGADRWRFIFDSKPNYKDSSWRIGPAKSSYCADHGPHDNFGEDPAQDHTQNGLNGVAGVGIGSCQEKKGDATWDCLWTKDMQVKFFDGEVVLSYWRHLHTPPDRGFGGGVSNSVHYRINGESDTHKLDSGFTDGMNDEKWIHRHHIIPERSRSIAFGFCYRKGENQSSFAGWSIDDVRVRQSGCQMKN